MSLTTLAAVGAALDIGRGDNWAGLGVANTILWSAIIGIVTLILSVIDDPRLLLSSHSSVHQRDMLLHAAGRSVPSLCCCHCL